MSNANLKQVNFSSNTWLDWMNLHNDIVAYLNGLVYTNSFSDVSTSNIATANAVNAVHSRVLSVNSYANTVNTRATLVYDTASGAYSTSNTIYSTVTDLADFANSYSGWFISSDSYRYGVIPWIDTQGTVHLGTKIGFHGSNSSSQASANITYSSANDAFEFSSGLRILTGLEVTGEFNIPNLMKVEANGSITGAVSGSETIWISPRELANSTISTHQTPNGSIIPVFQFHPAVFANNSLTVSLPKSWDQGNVSVRLYGLTNSSTQNSAVFTIRSKVIGDDEIISHSDSGTKLFCNSNSQGANTLILSGSGYTELNLINKANTGTDNESLVHFTIHREINDPADNLTTSLGLIGLKLKYNKRQLTDI